MWGRAAVPQNRASISEMKLNFWVPVALSTLNFRPGRSTRAPGVGFW